MAREARAPRRRRFTPGAELSAEPIERAGHHMNVEGTRIAAVKIGFGSTPATASASTTKSSRDADRELRDARRERASDVVGRRAASSPSNAADRVEDAPCAARRQRHEADGHAEAPLTLGAHDEDDGIAEMASAGERRANPAIERRTIRRLRGDWGARVPSRRTAAGRPARATRRSSLGASSATPAPAGGRCVRAYRSSPVVHHVAARSSHF